MCFNLQFYCWFFWTTFFISFIFYSISFIVMSIMNNVKGIKVTEKQLKLFEYLRKNINNNGFRFLQEAHSLSNDEQELKDDFRGPLFFSYWKSNFCGVAICYFGTEAFKVVSTSCNRNGQILIPDAELNGTNFLLIDFYNSDSESEQVSAFSTLQKLLEKVDDFNKKNVVLGSDFYLIFDCKFDAHGGNPILKKVSSKTNWNKRKSLFMWYLEDKKSQREMFFISSEPHFQFHWKKAWFFSNS